MTFRDRVVGLGLQASLLAAFGGLAGCSESPSMTHARRTREGALARSTAMVATLDEYRAYNLAETGSVIDERTRRDARRAGENVGRVRDYFQEWDHRWRERQPGYRQAIAHQLDGDPAAIESTAPHFIY
jgi:hypothetical protein